VWSVKLTSAVSVLCQGAFAVAVSEGLVEAACAHIGPACPATLAGSDGRAVHELRAVQTVPLQALVQVPSASAQLQLRALVEGCSVCTSDCEAARPLRTALHSPSPRWQQVRCREVACTRMPSHRLLMTRSCVQVLSSVEQSAAQGPAPVVLVCGAKKVGKSSLCRALINTLLQTHPAVALLETDLGQPELGPPGLVSLTRLSRPLTAPPHLNCSPPGESVFVGDISPQAHPALYLAAVQKLHVRFREAESRADESTPSHRVPLIINTSGWVKALGLDLLVDLISATSPTHVVALQSDNARRNLPPGRFWEAPGALPGTGPLLEEAPGIGAQAEASAAASECDAEGIDVERAPAESGEVRVGGWEREVGSARSCCLCQRAT